MLSKMFLGTADSHTRKTHTAVYHALHKSAYQTTFVFMKCVHIIGLYLCELN